MEALMRRKLAGGVAALALLAGCGGGGPGAGGDKFVSALGDSQWGTACTYLTDTAIFDMKQIVSGYELPSGDVPCRDLVEQYRSRLGDDRLKLMADGRPYKNEGDEDPKGMRVYPDGDVVKEPALSL